MTVVEVPQRLPIHEGMRFAHSRERLLRDARQYGKEPVFRKTLIGEIPQKAAPYPPAPVLVVTRFEGQVRTLFKRIMG